MDWSPSLSCSVSSSCPDPQDSSIADSSKDSDKGGTSENGGVGDGAEAATGTSLGMDTSTADLYFAPLPSHDGPPRSDLQDMYMDPRLTEHIVGLCLIKLQQASSGRHHSLLRQAQLKCMLHRIQMHTLFRPILDPCSPSYAYDPVFQGSNSTANVPLDSLQGYDWDQDLLDSNQLASSLSLDLLLSMGALAPSVDANLVSSTIDQGLFNLGQLVMPMEPFTSDFATLTTSAPTSTALADVSSAQQQQQQQKRIQSTPPPSDIKTIEQSTSAAAVTSALNGSSGAESRPLPGQSYFDLLLATNSNETLSQLMSTSATSNGAAPNLSLSALPPALAISAVDSQRAQGPQQTIPLTTKEIMDAFSGQFPIKLAEAVDSGPPVTTIETAGCPFPSPEASTPSPMEAVEALDPSVSVGQGPSEDGTENLHPDHASSEVSSCGEPLADPSQVPPALIMHDNEEHDVVEAELTESMDVDLAIQDMTLKSPPPSPRKSRSGSSDRSPSPTRTCVHNHAKSRSNRRKSQVLRRRPKTLVHTPSLMERLSLAMMEDSQDSDSQLAGHMHTDTVDPLQDGDSEYDLAEEEYDDHHYPYKRRRASEDSSASSSSESSPESSPPSPRTPPPHHDGQDYESSPPSPAHGPCESDLGQCTATTCIADDDAKDLFLEKSGDKRKRPTEHCHTACDNDINHDGDLQIHRRIQSTETARPGMTPIMTTKDLVGVKAMVSLSSTTTSAVLAVESVLNLRHAQDGAETDVGVEEGDAAVAAGAASGILTSTVHSRYPLRRQSVRLLQRLSGRA